MLATKSGRRWSVQEEKGHIRLNVRSDSLYGIFPLKRPEKIQERVTAGKSV